MLSQGLKLRIFVHQDGVVTELWPVTARGCSW